MNAPWQLMLLLPSVILAKTCNFTEYVSVNKPDKSFQGFTIFAPGGEQPEGTRVYIMDNTGAVVHHWDSQIEMGCFPGFHLQRDGRMLMTYCPSGGVEGGGVIRAEWNGSIAWNYQNKYMHHDAIELPNGNVMTPFLDSRTAAETTSMGGTDGKARNSDGVVEIKPTGPDTGEIVWSWRFWDHMVQDTDPSKPNYGNVSVSPGRMDVNSHPPRMDGADWCHMNAVDYNPELDQVVFSCRNFGEVYIIDHSTTIKEAATSTGGRSGKGGDFLWRWGNPQNYGQGGAADQWLNGQHDVHWVQSDVPGRSEGAEPANTLMVFDNVNTTLGPSHPEERSTVPVLQLPTPDHETGRYPEPKVDDRGYLPTEPSWSWGMGGFAANHISGAQRMGNGNTVVTNGETGQIVEVDPSGEVVWSWQWAGSSCAVVPPPQVPPYKPLGNCFFRTYRYPATYPGLAGRNLTTPVECQKGGMAFV